MDALRKAGDSLRRAHPRRRRRNVPVGLGEPLFDKLDADIAYAMMGINAVKGVEIGAGFASVTQRGTTHGDALTPAGLQVQQRRRRAGRHQHRAGPGGVASPSSPPARSSRPRESIDIDGHATEVVTKGRHDPCVGIRATPIAEAMLALVVMEHALRHRAQCGDVALRAAADQGVVPVND